MKLSDQELLKRVLYEDRHDDANDRLDQDLKDQKSAAQERKERIQKEQAKRARKKKVLRIAAPFVALFVLTSALLGFEYLSSWNRVHRNVSVARIELGGKTPKEAQSYLNDLIASYLETPISINYSLEDNEATTPDSEDEAEREEGDLEHLKTQTSWPILAEDIGLSFDTTAAVSSAYSFGRSGNFFSDLQERFMSYFNGYELDLAYDYDEDLSSASFELIRDLVNVEPLDSRVLLRDGEFVVESGEDGVILNEDYLISSIANTLLDQSDEVEVLLELYPRYIDDDAAHSAADSANELSSLAVDVNYEGQNWSFDSESIARLIEFKRSDRIEEDDIVIATQDTPLDEEHHLEILVSVDRVSEHIIEDIGTEVGRAPRNAQFVVNGDQVSIQPSVTGAGVNAQQLAFDISEILLLDDPDERTVELSMSEISPRRSTEDAEAMGIKERVGSYTTNFSLGNAPRLHNIQLMARMLDGIIVAPGEEFSINGATGYRTAADGFQAAGVIVQGEMSTAVGGGICQVSTTMFNAVMNAGLQVTQRINHSVFLSSYNPGKDAAIAAHGPDFRFRNTLDSYILISTSSTNSSVTISFFGTDPGYDVDIRTGTFSRNDFSTTEIRDSSIPRGERKIERAGQRGGSVNVYYTVRDGDRIVREQTFTSRYRTVDQIVRIGTGPAETDD